MAGMYANLVTMNSQRLFSFVPDIKSNGPWIFDHNLVIILTLYIVGFAFVKVVDDELLPEIFGKGFLYCRPQ